MFRIIMAAMAASLLLWGPIAAAQEATSSERQLELAGRYVQLTVMGDLRKTVEILVEQAIVQNGEADEAQTRFMREQMPRMLESAARRTFDNLVPLYARTFTEAELEALVGFYESPLGLSIAEKAISITMEEQGIVQAEMMRYLVELWEKYCTEFACADGPGVSQMGK